MRRQLEHGTIYTKNSGASVNFKTRRRLVEQAALLAARLVKLGGGGLEGRGEPFQRRSDLRVRGHAGKLWQEAGGSSFADVLGQALLHG